MYVKGEKGSKNCWYVGYALLTKNCIEVQRWSYWCKKFGVYKAGELLKKSIIRRVGGVYTSPEKSYNVKFLVKKISES